MSLSFTMDAKRLSELTTQAFRTVSKRNTVKVLGGIMLEATKTRLVLSSTDMEVSQRITAKLVRHAKPGEVIVNARYLDKALRTFDGDVTITETKGEVIVSQGHTKIALEKYVTEDYPRLPKIEGKPNAVVVMGPEFKRAFAFVQPHASRDESRPVLVGVLIRPQDDRLVFNATDSFRLAFTWSPAAVGTTFDDVDTIVRREHLGEVARLLKNELDFVEIRRQDKWVFFKVGDVEIMSRRIEGQFPDMGQLVPDNWYRETTVARDELESVLKRIKTLEPSPTIPARFTYETDNGELGVGYSVQDGFELNDAATVRHMIVAKRPKDEPEVPDQEVMGYNPVFMLDAVQSFDTDDITLCTITPLRPSLVRDDREGQGVLVMPIRLAN